MADDKVVISREQLSNKENFIKNRLYAQQKDKKTKHSDLGSNFGREDAPDYTEPFQMKFKPRDPCETGKILFDNFLSDEYKQTAAKGVPKAGKGASDDKMNSFLDEMR